MNFIASKAERQAFQFPGEWDATFSFTFFSFRAATGAGSAMI